MSHEPVVPDKRPEVLRAARNLKMAGSQHAYVRGSTAKFYEWLEASSSTLPKGPSVWICGDCHIGNLGPLIDADGRIDVQIRDLDQTVIGNPAHDIVRLALSLASMSRSLDLPGVTVARMLEEVATGYARGLLRGPARDRPPVVEAMLKEASKRKWKQLALERLQDAKPTIPLGKRFWALSGEEREAVEALFAEDEVRAAVAHWKTISNPGDLKLLDAAYWMKGCSSLGRLRYAVLLGAGGKKAAPVLIDIKEAVKAAAPYDPSADAPRDNAQRVVAGACALSPNLGERMIAARFLGKSVVVRELAPQDLKPRFDELSQEEAMSVAGYLAGVVGAAHGRQMSPDIRKSWANDLERARSKSIEAPTWLWASVVDLVSVHEAAYLEHCRRYALSEAA